MSAGARATQSCFDAVVVAASYGGFAAASTMLAGLPASFATPVVLVLHRSPANDDATQARLLARGSGLLTRLAADGAGLEAGVALVPAGAHATVTSERRLALTLAPSAADRRRAGDVLFVSAANALGSRVIGVVLTGRLSDGTEGVRAIKRRGGRVLAQDPAEAPAASMPISALATGCVDFALPLPYLSAALAALTMGPGAAELLAVATPSWARLHA